MLDFFKSKPILSDEDFLFQIETYKWLLKYFGGNKFYKETKLILPTQKYFPIESDSVDVIVSATFQQVKKYAGLEKWECNLVAQEEDIDTKIASTINISGVPTGPLGTFSIVKDAIQITYNPALVNQPTQLVATFAHELSHYLTITAKEEPPGGWANAEFATDLCAVFLGFGIFMANSAVNFKQYRDVDSQGWSHERNGYLSETELLYSLAIFSLLKNIDNNDVIKYLKPGLTKLYKKCINELNDHLELIDDMKKVNCISPNKKLKPF